MRYCFALDLKKDKKSILAYEIYHRQVWPEIEETIRKAKIKSLEIYRVENRLFMIMETKQGFSFIEKSRLDRKNSKVQEWEKLMDRYQKLIPNTKQGEKWRLMDRIYKL
jgi:L-rhamnose mutarotase